MGSLVSGAAFGAAVYFVFSFIGLLLNAAFSGGAFLSLVMSTLMACLSIFLIGFFAGVIVVTPLFKALEKAKRRTVWPYVAAAVGVSILSLIALGALPRFADPGLASIVAVLTAGLFTAFDFGKRMEPLWRAVQQAEERAERNIFYIN